MVILERKAISYGNFHHQSQNHYTVMVTSSLDNVLIDNIRIISEYQIFSTNMRFQKLGIQKSEILTRAIDQQFFCFAYFWEP